MQNSYSVKKKEISELTANISQGIPNPVIDQGSFCKQYIADNADIKLSKDKKTDSFLDEMYKKKISNEIRQKRWEKKLQEDLKTFVAFQDFFTNLNEKNG